MTPASGASSPAIILNCVDFPVPLRPTKASACIQRKGGRRHVEMKRQPEPERDVVDVEHAGLSPAGPALASARQRQINNRINRITEGFSPGDFCPVLPADLTKMFHVKVFGTIGAVLRCKLT
jgi:hypothetical protein